MIPVVEAASKMSLKCRLFSEFARQQLFRSSPACGLHISATYYAESKAVAGKKRAYRKERFFCFMVVIIVFINDIYYFV